MRHWLAFTLRSVLEQREPDFVYWMLCDAARRAHTEPLLAGLPDDRVRAVYSDEVRVAARSLPAAERYLLARLDSDDLYAPEVAAELLRHRPRTEFLQFNLGYGCDVLRGAVHRWRSRSSPFYCRVHGRELRNLHEWTVLDHTRVRQRATVLAPDRFLVTIHGLNTSSTLVAGRGGGLPPTVACAALRRFGIGGDASMAALCARGARGARGATARVPRDLAECVALACELAAPRRVLAVGAGPGREAAVRWSATSPATAVYAIAAPPGDEARHDVVVVDACAPARLDDALRAVEPWGLVVLAPDVPEPSDRWVFDRYREVERATAAGRRRGVRLLGRMIGPLS